MGTKKDVAQALKEQLDNLTASPDIKVWEQLELELKEKKRKKKIVPFWFDFTTIGLLLLLIAFLNKDSISLILHIDKKHVESIERKRELDKSRMILQESNKLMDSKNAIQENDAATKAESIRKDSLLENMQNSSSFFNNPSENDSNINRTRNVKHQNFKNNNTNYVQKKDKQEDTNNTLMPYDSFNSEDNTVSDRVVSDIKISLNKSNNDKLVRLQETNIEEKINDTINEAVKDSLVKNTVEIDNKEKTSDSLSNDSPGKWSVFPNAAVTYYDGFKNSFSDQTNLNYGIYVTYLPHNDLSFRIGVNSLNLAQTSSPIPNRILIQEVCYLEIPLELKYSLIKRNIQTSLVAGTSYLILQEANSIVMEDNNMNEIDNSSDFVESTLSINIGFQFQTKIYKKLYFNLEPMFKYHFKPYAINQDFNPFIISLTGGVEYKF